MSNADITPDSIRLRALLNTKRARILNVATQYGISNIRVFGSVAKGTANMNSDIDFLVDVPEKTVLHSISIAARFKEEIESILKVDVDVVPSNSLSSCMNFVLDRADRRGWILKV